MGSRRMKPWWLRLARYALPQWKGVSLSLLLTCLGVLIVVLKPWPLKVIVDSILPRKPLPAEAAWLAGLPGGESASTLLAWLAIATLLLFVAAWCREMAQVYVQGGVGSRMAYNL